MVVEILPVCYRADQTGGPPRHMDPRQKGPSREEARSSRRAKKSSFEGVHASPVPYLPLFPRNLKGSEDSCEVSLWEWPLSAWKPENLGLDVGQKEVGIKVLSEVPLSLTGQGHMLCRNWAIRPQLLRTSLGMGEEGCL